MMLIKGISTNIWQNQENIVSIIQKIGVMEQNGGEWNSEYNDEEKTDEDRQF